MAFCANCGNKVGDNDKFCAKCGASRVPGAAAAQPEPPPPPPVQPAAADQQPADPPLVVAGNTGESSTGLKPNVAGLLCYLGVWITGIIFLVLEKNSKFVRFHAAQSLVFFGFINILSLFLSVIFSHVWFLGSFLNGLIGLGAFILWIVLMVKAYQGETYKIPIAGDIASGIVGKV
jgi:uncharacterized membrane protein